MCTSFTWKNNSLSMLRQNGWDRRGELCRFYRDSSIVALFVRLLFSLFFFRYIKYKGGGGFVAKGAIVRSFDSVGEDGTNLTLNFCLRMRPLMRILMCMWKGEKLWKSDGSLSNEITRRQGETFIIIRVENILFANKELLTSPPSNAYLFQQVSG